MKKRYWLRGGLIGLIIGVIIFVGHLFFMNKIFILLVFYTTPFGALIATLFGCDILTGELFIALFGPSIILSLILFLACLIIPYIGWYVFVGIILGLVYPRFKKRFIGYKLYFSLFLMVIILLLLLLQYIIGNYTYQYMLNCPI